MENSSSVTEVNQTERLHAKDGSRYLWLGVGLIALGVTWLTWNMDVLRWSWFERYGFVLLGAALVAKSLVQKTYSVAAGLGFLSIGLFHLYLDYTGVGSMRYLWPVYFLLIGLSFMANFLLNTKRWPSLTLSLVSLMTGGLLLSRSYFHADVPALELIRTYWPLTLVASGIILLATALVRRKRLEESERTEW